MLLGLRDHNAQDTILHRCSNSILINAAWESEGARKRANATLRDPESLLRLLFLHLLWLSSFLSRDSTGWGALLLDSCLVTGLRSGGLAFGDGGCLSPGLNGSGWGASGVGALGAAANAHCLGVRELDRDIALVDASELAVKLKAIWELLDVKLWDKCLLGARDVARCLARVGVVVVEEAEEWAECGGWGWGGEDGLWVERHCACLFWRCKDFCKRSSLW